MTYNHTIKPTTINILGNSPRATTTRQSSYTPNTQEESTTRQSLWQRIKFGAKKVFDCIKPVVTYIKDELVPIATAIAGVMNAWSNYRRRMGKAKDSVCYA